MFTDSQIETIVNSQLDTLLWSTVDTAETSPNGYDFENFDEFYSADNATPELRAKLTEELEALRVYNVDFTAEFETAVNAYSEHFADDFLGQFGHDLALTRNHHGAGFWDRGLGEVGDTLTKWAESLGEMNIFHGHDSIHPTTWAGKFHAEEVR